MATRVTYENIFSETRTNVYDLLNSRTNVPDPVSSTSQHRKFVYSRFPDVKATSFGGYPFIVVRGADQETEQEGASLDNKSKFVNFTVDIEVYASDRGYGKEDGKGLSHADTISNAIFKTLNNKTNQNTLQANALSFANLTSTNIQEQDFHNERVYFRSFIFNLRTKMQVTE